MGDAGKGMTKGLLGVLSKSKQRDQCPCGFPMPVYPGRYPKSCPKCGDERKEAKSA